jgi:hypothetical protein
MYTNQLTETAMPRHRLHLNFKSNSAPRINLPRKPAPIGLSREELRKIVVDLIG